MKLIIVCLMLSCPAFIASAQESNISQLPAFGSSCAGIEMLSPKSSFIPKHALTRPGKLTGKWLLPSKNSVLEVRSRYNKDNPPDEDFSMLIQSGTNTVRRDFDSSYSTFRIYGVDVDADGKEEIVRERGTGGHGTFVYVERLEVLTIADDCFVTIFACDLNGYLWEPGMGDPVSWYRQYRWLDTDNDKMMEIELTLVAPPVIPKYTGDINDLQVLQHPTMLFKYNPGRKRYEILREDFRPLIDGMGVSAPDPLLCFKDLQACYKYIVDSETRNLEYLDLPPHKDIVFKVDKLDSFLLQEGTDRKVIVIDPDVLTRPYLHFSSRGAQGNGDYYLFTPIQSGFRFVGKLAGNNYTWGMIDGKAQFTTWWHMSASSSIIAVYDWVGLMFKETSSILRE